jgi:hypothetical protein
VFLYTDRHCGWWYQRVPEPSRFSSWSMEFSLSFNLLLEVLYFSCFSP